MTKQAAFSVGQLVKHALFEYRGVIIDVDPTFMLSEDWYNLMAKSRPPKDDPWYRVLVHNATHETYVAENNLEPYHLKTAINHPHLEHYFSAFEDGCYILDKYYAN